MVVPPGCIAVAACLALFHEMQAQINNQQPMISDAVLKRVEGNYGPGVAEAAWLVIKRSVNLHRKARRVAGVPTPSVPGRGGPAPPPPPPPNSAIAITK